MMKYKRSAERKQFLVKFMKEAGKGMVILIAAILAFKFISWNFFKLEQAAAIAGELGKEPSAVNVNLEVSGKIGSLFRQGFTYNKKGNYYITNRFDITGQISDTGDLCTGNSHILVNGRDISTFLVFRFKQFNVLYTGGYYFVFNTADSGIEDLVRLDRTFPDIENSLFKLAIAQKGAKGEGDEDKKELIYQCFQGIEKELTYGSAKVSIPLPGVFNKGKLYEIVFDYKVTGKAKAVVMLSPAPNRYELDAAVEGKYRKVSLLFSPQEDVTASILDLLGRSQGKKGPFDGTVSFKDISLYRYEQDYPWLKELHGSHVAYFDSVDRLKEEFVGVKYFQK
jgi:hypothetical protein